MNGAKEKTMADVSVQDLEQAREVLRLVRGSVCLPWQVPPLIDPLGLAMDELDRRIKAGREADKVAQAVMRLRGLIDRLQAGDCVLVHTGIVNTAIGHTEYVFRVKGKQA